MLEDEPVFTGLVCPQCGAHCDPPSEAVHDEIRCPRCLAIILFATPAGSIPLENKRRDEPLPPLAEPPIFSGVRPAPAADATADDEGAEFRLKESQDDRPKSWYVPPPLPPEAIEEADEEAAAKSPPEPLGVTFGSGAFTLVWLMSVLKQWIVLAAIVVLAAVLGVATLTAFSDVGSISWGAGVLLMFPALAAAIWATTFAGAYLAAIVERTVYGHDQTSDWPDGDWRQRFGDGFRVLFLLVQALMVGGIIGGIFSAAVPALFWWICAPITFLLFPILALSALETNVVAAPLSLPIWRSLRVMRPAWVAFYGVSAGVWLAWAGVAALCCRSSPWLLPQFAAPLLAAVIFAYARQLGRLAGYLVRRGGFLVPGEEEVD